VGAENFAIIIIIIIIIIITAILTIFAERKFWRKLENVNRLSLFIILRNSSTDWNNINTKNIVMC
jgi:hypothetical protein